MSDLTPEAEKQIMVIVEAIPQPWRRIIVSLMNERDALRADLDTARADALREAADRSTEVMYDQIEPACNSGPIKAVHEAILDLIDTPTSSAPSPEAVAPEDAVDILADLYKAAGEGEILAKAAAQLIRQLLSTPSPEAVARAALEWAAGLDAYDCDGTPAGPFDQRKFVLIGTIRGGKCDPATIAAIITKAGGRGMSDLQICDICHGEGRLMVGMSFPPNKTVAVKYEYDPCPACKSGPHSFYAMRIARQRGWKGP